MRESTINTLLTMMQADIEKWEEAARFWEDPAIIGDATRKGKDIAATYRERVQEWRKLLEQIKAELASS